MELSNNNLIIFFLIIWILTIVYFNCKINNIRENFDNTPQYNADIESIRNLGSIAKALIGGNAYTFPGNLGVSGTLSSPTINSINTNIQSKYDDLKGKIDTLTTTANRLDERITNTWNRISNVLNGSEGFGRVKIGNWNIDDDQNLRFWTKNTNCGERDRTQIFWMENNHGGSGQCGHAWVHKD